MKIKRDLLEKFIREELIARKKFLKKNSSLYKLISEQQMDDYDTGSPGDTGDTGTYFDEEDFEEDFETEVPELDDDLSDVKDSLPEYNSEDAEAEVVRLQQAGMLGDDATVDDLPEHWDQVDSVICPDGIDASNYDCLTATDRAQVDHLVDQDWSRADAMASIRVDPREGEVVDTVGEPLSDGTLGWDAAQTREWEEWYEERGLSRETAMTQAAIDEFINEADKNRESWGQPIFREWEGGVASVTINPSRAKADPGTTPSGLLDALGIHPGATFELADIQGLDLSDPDQRAMAVEGLAHEANLYRTETGSWESEYEPDSQQYQAQLHWEYMDEPSAAGFYGHMDYTLSGWLPGGITTNEIDRFTRSEYIDYLVENYDAPWSAEMVEKYPFLSPGNPCMTRIGGDRLSYYDCASMRSTPGGMLLTHGGGPAGGQGITTAKANIEGFKMIIARPGQQRLPPNSTTMLVQKTCTGESSVRETATLEERVLSKLLEQESDRPEARGTRGASNCTFTGTLMPVDSPLLQQSGVIYDEELNAYFYEPSAAVGPTVPASEAGTVSEPEGTQQVPTQMQGRDVGQEGPQPGSTESSAAEAGQDEGIGAEPGTSTGTGGTTAVQLAREQMRMRQEQYREAAAELGITPHGERIRYTEEEEARLQAASDRQREMDIIAGEKNAEMLRYLDDEQLNMIYREAITGEYAGGEAPEGWQPFEGCAEWPCVEDAIAYFEAAGSAAGMTGEAAMEAVGPVRPPGSPAPVRGDPEGTRAGGERAISGIGGGGVPTGRRGTEQSGFDVEQRLGVEEGLKRKPVRRYENSTITESQQSRFKKLAGILK